MTAKAMKEDLAVSVSTSGVPKDRRSLRVVSARGDLTGQYELAWAADTGSLIGNARCTQNFQFSPDAPAQVRPTMMLCWRTSAAKSVYVIAVNMDGGPSTKDTVAVISRVWSELG